MQFFFSPLRAHLAWKRWYKWNAPIWPITLGETYIASNRNRGEIYILQKEDKISSSRAHDPAQLLARSKEYMHNEKRRKPCLLSSARMLKTGSLSRGPPCLESPGVTVIWASPRFGHPHSRIPSDMDIPCNPNPNPNRKGNTRGEFPYPEGIGIGDAQNAGMPITRGCPYHCNTGDFSRPKSNIQIKI